MKTAGAGAALFAVLLAASAGPATAQVAPDRAWETRDTPHFRVTYPAGLDSLAVRAAAAAERAWDGLAARLDPPPTPIELLVADDADVPNAFASVAPYPWIFLHARPPFGDPDLGAYGDWLDVVLVHELTHVFHLEAAGPLGRALRRIVGRPPSGWPLFPHAATPAWTTEGLAVYHESALTGAGRVAGGAADRAVRAAAAEGAFPSLAFVSGSPSAWPAGATPYLFGGAFLDHVARARGEAALEAWVDEGARTTIPLRLDAAAGDALGTTWSEAWAAWRSAELARWGDFRRRAARSPAPERLVADGWIAFHPRHSPAGDRITYARFDGRDDVALAIVDAASGAEIGRTRAPAVGVPAWAPDGSIVYGGRDWQGPYRWWDRLWRFEGDGARPLPSRARLSHPDVGPDGRIVAIESGGGTNRLVVLDPDDEAPTPLVPFDLDVQWAYPRWSPDGGAIAVSRWRRGGDFDVVMLDPGEPGSFRFVAAAPGQDLAPAWSPDGRWIVFGSDRDGIADLHAVDLGTGRGPLRVTRAIGGAYFPDVAPDGRAIVYSAYHHDGWSIERVPFDPAGWTEAEGAGDAAGVRTTPTAPGAHGADVGPPRPWTPGPTLAPRWWLPLAEPGEEVLGRDVLGARVGLEAAAEDLVGRHAWGAAATADVEHGRVEAALEYVNASLGTPVVAVSASQRWAFEGLALGVRDPEVDPDTLFVVRRDRAVGVSLTRPVRRPFAAAAVTAGAGVVEERRVVLEGDLEESAIFRLEDPVAVVPEAFAAAGWSNARSYPLSIGPSRGATVRGRATWRAFTGGSALEERWGTVEALGYAPLGVRVGFAEPVLALRASGGRVGGPGAGSGRFPVGGAAGEGLDAIGLEAVGGPRLPFPVRGYPRGIRRGTRAWSATAELRFPVALPEAGAGLLPLFLDKLSTGAFVDAGDAWDACGEAPCPGREPLVSAGAEVVVEGTAFFRVPLAVRLGVARALVAPTGTVAYVRLGRAF